MSSSATVPRENLATYGGGTRQRFSPARLPLGQPHWATRRVEAQGPECFLCFHREREAEGRPTHMGWGCGISQCPGHQDEAREVNGVGRGGGADVIPLNISGLRLYPM